MLQAMVEIGAEEFAKALGSGVPDGGAVVASREPLMVGAADQDATGW